MNQPSVAGYSPAVTVLLAIYPLWFLSNYSLRKSERSGDLILLAGREEASGPPFPAR